MLASSPPDAADALSAATAAFLPGTATDEVSGAAGFPLAGAGCAVGGSGAGGFSDGRAAEEGAGGSPPDGGADDEGGPGPPARGGEASGGGGLASGSIRPKSAAARRILKKYMASIADVNATSSAIVKK